jgi:hypothetical protein
MLKSSSRRRRERRVGSKKPAVLRSERGVELEGS